MSNPHYNEAKRLRSAVTTKDWSEPSIYIDRRLAAAQTEATLALAYEARTANELKRIELAHTLMRHHTENVDYSEEIDKLAAWGFDTLFTSEHHHVYNSAGESIDGTERTDLRNWVSTHLGLGDTK